MTVFDGAVFANISATTAPFRLGGGRYNAAVLATFGGGSVMLQALGPDGTTWLSIGASSDFAANDIATVDLAPGQYRLIATATGVSCSVWRVPS